jgi:hypothetical protein
MARETPSEFVKTYAGILPRELDVSDSTLADMSYEEIEAKLTERRAALARGAATAGTRAGRGVELIMGERRGPP